MGSFVVFDILLFSVI